MPSQRLYEGALLGSRYEILEIVGRGGMGTVYRARDSRLDTLVAVKEMAERYQTIEERESAARQFEREAKLLGQLHHPNLPRVTDYFVESDHCYLIMEFVTGETLDAQIRQNGAMGMPLPDVLSWGVQLAEVLVYLHGQDPPVVFRDLKPANIMVQEDRRIKLIDFGIARRFQSGATKDTLLYGSPGYSPPEQYGRSQTDPRSDIYALGATLHHLVTGRDPAPTPFKFPPIRVCNPALPAVLDTFIARCVEMDENRRCQTASEALAALQTIQSQVTPASLAHSTGRGGRTSHTTPAPRDRMESKSSALRSVAAVAGALVLLASIGIVAMRARQGTVRPAAPPAIDRTPQPSQGTEVPSTLSAPGSLKVVTEPGGATVYLDGEQAGTTPLQVAEVSAGNHRVRIVPATPEFVETTRDIEIDAGTPLSLELQLARASTGGQTPAAPTIEMQNITVQRTTVREPDGSSRPGLLIHPQFQLTGASGKTGAIAAFFYGLDRVTPLRPRLEGTMFQNRDGQLSVARSFQAPADPAEFSDATLFIPEAVFPLPYGQVTWRLMIFVDGKSLFQSPIGPLVQ